MFGFWGKMLTLHMLLVGMWSGIVVPLRGSLPPTPARPELELWRRGGLLDSLVEPFVDVAYALSLLAYLQVSFVDEAKMEEVLELPVVFKERLRSPWFFQCPKTWKPRACSPGRTSGVLLRFDPSLCASVRPSIHPPGVPRVDAPLTFQKYASRSYVPEHVPHADNYVH